MERPYNKTSDVRRDISERRQSGSNSFVRITRALKMERPYNETTYARRDILGTPGVPPALTALHLKRARQKTRPYM
jgi:hypothetical protein